MREKELHSEIEIGASAERVWGILTDFASYPRWNPFIRSIGGELEVGERLEVRLEPPDSRGITMRPTVLRVEPNRLMRWLGRLLVPRASVIVIGPEPGSRSGRRSRTRPAR
jgi:hypothetical protein